MITMSNKEIEKKNVKNKLNNFTQTYKRVTSPKTIIQKQKYMLFNKLILFP